MPEFDIQFKFSKREDGRAVLRFVSAHPFEITTELIDALLAGFEQGKANEAAIEI